MPAPLLTAYATMLPRLEAEEDMRLIAAVAAGTGSLKKQDSAEYRRGLLRAMNAGRPVQKASHEELKGMGITVKEVPRG